MPPETNHKGQRKRCRQLLWNYMKPGRKSGALEKEGGDNRCRRSKSTNDPYASLGLFLFMHRDKEDEKEVKWMVNADVLIYFVVLEMNWRVFVYMGIFLLLGVLS